MNIFELLKYTVDEGCSDLHLSSGEVPVVRKNGDLIKIENQPVLTNDIVKEMLHDIMTDAHRALLEKQSEVDFSYAVDDVARFRINAFHQARGLSAALRSLAFETPTLETMGLSGGVFKKICEYPNGLVLITGATGSGKSTTLAAIINYINSIENRGEHIITIEDPVEYIFKSDQCLIQQRELGRDTRYFHDALRAALREDPDIIMIGEMRDLDTIRLALTAAETGHLVFGTLHTRSAPSAIDRIIDVFPGNEKDMIREILAQSLRAIIAQRLLKTPDGTIRPVYEILICTDAVRNLIREHKIPQLISVMQTGRKFGMQTMQQHIEELLGENKILPVDDGTPES